MNNGILIDHTVRGYKDLFIALHADTSFMLVVIGSLWLKCGKYILINLIGIIDIIVFHLYRKSISQHEERSSRASA
ncbi:hypothetical protein J23TS9_40670 [Paenibacillus sp. J23TS9]|nr:hypothetical protein J23TS9_40670 [Paenibacillus sp. J23TS9]